MPQISGICLIAIGAWVKAKYGDFTHVSAGDLTTGPVFLIIIGVIVSFIGFLGCCGAYKENYCMVTTFAILLGIIFVLEIAAGAYAYSRRDKLDEYATEALKKAVDNYSNDEKTIDNVQRKGCVKAVESFLKKHLIVVGGVGVGIAFIQVIGIVFACCLMRSIKKEYEVM
ncbi:CD63 antigen [Acropora cervicornis]|uniref:CD63 antigen n=1 Tax=Acropora cervicornis TaxID=6130 RepID=A0AAD9Q189_ACRCE|nr:CD63 antigen [Acropora cervicornis]